MKFRRLLLTLFALAGSAAAQFTVVTGTVTDPNGLAYANGTISAGLVYPGGTTVTLSGQPYSAPSGATALDGSGKFTIRLGDNSVLLPGGTQWTFLICSAAGTVQPAGGKGPVCFNVPALTISGSSQSITSNISAVPPPALSINPGTGTLTSVSCTAPTVCTPSPIVSTGAVSCPTCATTTSGGALSGTSPITVSSGGAIACATCNTSAASLTAHAPVVGAGGQAENTIASTGNNGAALLSQGASTDPVYGAINLAGGSNIVSGVLPPANGGTANISVSGQGYTFLPFDMANNINSTASTAAPSTNGVSCFQIKLLDQITFTKVGISVSTTSNGNHYYIGIYSGDGTTLLRQASFTLGAGTGALSVTVSSTTLTPGPYWECWGADNTAAILLAAISPQTAAFNLFNQNTVHLGNSSNSISAGVMPASIGTISSVNQGMPLVMLEP